MAAREHPRATASASAIRLFPVVAVLRGLLGLVEILLLRRALGARFAHVLAAAVLDAFLLGVDVGVEAGFLLGGGHGGAPGSGAGTVGRAGWRPVSAPPRGRRRRARRPGA